jgi:hypothetical protein
MMAPRPKRRRMKGEALVLAFSIFLILFSLALTAGVAFVIIHFILKFW